MDCDYTDGPALKAGLPVSKDVTNEKKRSYLKVYENLPAQLLSVYGMSKYHKSSDEHVWEQLNVPLKSGAMWMTEYCSEDVERRGIAVNRFLFAMIAFMKYQQEAETVSKNKAIMKPELVTSLYEEIELVLPSYEYCLAPKKTTAKSGAAALRSSIANSATVVSTRIPAELDKHAKIVYDHLDKTKSSRLRMLIQWQGCGGLPYVAAVYQRSSQCFRYVGNKLHGTGTAEVSLTDFQSCIKKRHEVGCAGIFAEAPASTDNVDFP